ncbi:hypothetical protein ACFW1A_32755 [Kitasatospora sp. NPDC058965]|uniref:hypothetical protein n=1 Tax=Kitasatospora sp. NPDC058965 TaxID=3346682 RepID=UPI003675FE3A
MRVSRSLAVGAATAAILAFTAPLASADPGAGSAADQQTTQNHPVTSEEPGAWQGQKMQDKPMSDSKPDAKADSSKPDAGKADDKKADDKAKDEKHPEAGKAGGWMPHGGVHTGGGGLSVSGGGLASGAALLVGGIGAGAFALRRRRSAGNIA